jgi:PHP family Zn ribbon phosphoesterase
LHEILSKILGAAMATKKVWQEYNKLIEAFGNELNILLNVSAEELKKVTTEKIANTIIRNREGRIEVKPGYDGEYGEAVIDGEKQKKLF